MKLRFKHQKFQEDAVKATCDVFTGQINNTHRFSVDRGNDDSMLARLEEVGFGNGDIVLNEAELIKNLHEIQRQQGLELNTKIERLGNKPVFTIEMETGTGKTYTYIKTMYELNARYGWCKFIVVVPSVAIREGVYKTFQTTADHFAEEYGKRVRFFVYNSSRLNEIEQFANDSSINVMIINAQAFNSRGADSKRIRMELDSFRSRRPIDVIAATKPIIIVDEPQSVLGTDKKSNVTRESIKDFNPLFFLNYSATHRENFNKVYRLDAIDAYQQQLVKKIAVKGISVRGGTATSGYLYLQKINTYPKRKPTATVVFEFDAKSGSGIRRKTKTLEFGDDIYVHSGELEEYHDGYKITEINARGDELGGYVDFKNTLRIHEGEVIGRTNEEDIRRIQIRETIMTHLETEHKLYQKGIKVLSLFFIDKVDKYKTYIDGIEEKGLYAKIFEEEFEKAVKVYLEQQLPFDEDRSFREYLEKFTPSEIHAGYFSIDKKGHIVDSQKKRGESESDDVSAYDLIMKDKERLLSFEEPIRFIFSHSALREGWDNPNVFQICTLRESDAEIKKRQEIGRGLRLCVDKDGNRMDAETLGANLVHEINVLTVIANESYEKFAGSLQSEFNELIANHPKEVTGTLFYGRIVIDQSGAKQLSINDAIASDIYAELKNAGLIGQDRRLTADYCALSSDQKVEYVHNALDDDLKPYAEDIQKILSTVYDSKQGIPIVNLRKTESLNLSQEKYASKAFQELWSKINSKTYYTVEFNEDELVEKCIETLNRDLRVTKTEIVITEGYLKSLGKDQLEMYRDKVGTPVETTDLASNNVQYDLIGELSKSQNDGGTSLTRETLGKIFKGVNAETFAKFQNNPEEFIHNAKGLINSVKASVVVEHISYNKLNEQWDGGEIFINRGITGVYDQNLIDTPNHHLYDKLRYDSDIERNFAEELEKQEAVEVFVKLPKQFYIDTPMGHYNPDWAIAFHDDAGVKHIYFVAETKGVGDGQLDVGVKGIEKAKIECARKHFAKINNGRCVYGVCNSYAKLLELVNS